MVTLMEAVYGRLEILCCFSRQPQQDKDIDSHSQTMGLIAEEDEIVIAVARAVQDIATHPFGSGFQSDVQKGEIRLP